MLRTQILQLQHLMHRSNLKRSYFFTEKENTTMQVALSRRYVICHHIFTCNYWSWCGQWLLWTFWKGYLQESKTKVKKPNNSLQIWECMIYYLKKTLRNAQCSSSISSMQIRQALQYHKQEVKNGKRWRTKQHCAFHQTKIRLSNTCLGQTIKLKYGTSLQTPMLPQCH